MSDMRTYEAILFLAMLLIAIISGFTGDIAETVLFCFLAWLVKDGVLR